MTISVEQLAALVSGRLLGDSSVVCSGANPLGQATAGDVTMLDDPRQAASLVGSLAVAVVTKTELTHRELADRELVQIVVDDPHAAFTKIVSQYRPPIADTPMVQGVDPTAQIDPTANVHPSATIGPGVVIGARTRVMPGVVIMHQSQIGQDCILHAGVSLYEYTVLGDRVVLHSNCVVGANGFGYRQVNGRHVPSAQLGYVEIQSDVEIGAMVAIDRGTYGATRIGEGTKIDNQVQIAHNCQIGKHNLLCSQVGIAGSCRTGDHVVLAGQVGLKDHVTLGDGSIVAAQSGVMDDLPGGEVYFGSPAIPIKERMQVLASERKLPEIRRALKSLQRTVGRIETTLDNDGSSESSTATKPRAA
tara:strand:+ start:616683 stop:617765 length:1083 start_codon:yes stop_codon:yes gene_type:complete